MKGRKKCPKCGSTQANLQPYMGLMCIYCDKCGFDEACIYEVYAQEKTSQKAKGRHSPYKKGGGKRTRSRK